MAIYDGKEPLLTVSEAANYLNVSKMTVRRWTNNGTLACLRIGLRKERRFLESELQKLLSGKRAGLDTALASSDNAGRHHCLVCNDPEHEWDAILDAVIESLSQRSHVIFIGDTDRRKRLISLLSAHGIDANSLISSGDLSLLSVEESYLISGSFSANAALTYIESRIMGALEKGFKSLLFIGYVDWVFSNGFDDAGPLFNEVMTYEKKLNRMLDRYPTVTILCPYVLTRIDSKTIVDAFMAHPKLQLQSGVIDGLYP